MKYIDFDLEISPSTGEEYQVVVHSQAGEAHTTMRFPFDKALLKERMQELRYAILSSASTRRRVLSEEERAVQNFGQTLFHAFMSGEVLNRYDVSQEQARMQGIGLRLKLRILAPELAALPWEFLYDPRVRDYLCLSSNTPIIRHPEVPHRIQPLRVEAPLHILGVIASPDDQVKLDVEGEKKLMQKVLEDLQARGFVKLTWLDKPTWRELQRVIRRGPWHVFHFIGHGGFEAKTQEGAIILCDDDDHSYWLTATNLGVLLKDQRTIQMVLLNACEGARSSDYDLFSSTAATLIQKGIPAVLAMQEAITDEASIEFTRTFYEALAEGMPVDAAVAESRKAIRLGRPGTLEWGTPVLYMRSLDGILFDLQKSPLDSVIEETTEIKKPAQKIDEVQPSPPVASSAEKPNETIKQEGQPVQKIDEAQPPADLSSRAATEAGPQPSVSEAGTPTSTQRRGGEVPSQAGEKSARTGISTPEPTADPQRMNQLLVSLIQRQLAVLRSLNMTTWTLKLQQLEQRVLAETFTVLVVGKFSVGKSTFVNALLGKKLLPIRPIPTTAIITEIRWGETPKALLHFPQASEQGGPPREPQEISMSQLEHYLVIKDGKRAPANHPAMHEPPYAKVELFWPLDLCRDGVHIIDTPGVSDDPEREKITTNYITLADMVLYVLACDDQSSMSARQVIETIREASHEHIFFICNRINVIDAGEQDMVKGRCISLLAPFTKQGARHVFFLNARSALNGRLSGNSELLEQSGLSMVEQELQTFLTTERGRIKFIPPATELRASIRAARSILAEKAALPRADLQMPQVLHLKPQRALDRLELERQQLVTWLATFRDETRKRVNEEASDFYGTVAYKLESWVQTYEIKHPVGLLGVFSKEAQEKVVEEVTKFLTERVAHESQVWQASTLHPLLIRIVENMEQELNERIKRLAQNLEQADLKAVLGVPPTISSEAFSDFSVADTTMAALAGWKPQIFIPDLLLGGSGGAALNINAINRKIKEAVGKEYAQKLQTSRSALAIAITKGVDKTTYKKLGKVQGEVNHWLELKARNIQDQGTPIIEEKQQQQSKVDEVTPGLAAISDELDTIESEVDNLIKQVALAKSRV